MLWVIHPKHIRSPVTTAQENHFLTPTTLTLPPPWATTHRRELDERPQSL